MATLIQSKQIEGIVTASVVSGEFQVTGSASFTGSVGVGGQLTATSFVGDGSQLTFNGTGLVSGSQQIIISQVSGYNTFSSSLDSRLVSLENATDNTGSDSQTLSISGDQLTITSGNTITIPTGSDVSNQTLSFNQVNKQLTISDGNSVDLSSLGGGGGGGSSIWTTGSNFYKVSSDLQVTGSFSATSLTGSIDYSNLTNVPSGLVSSSVQITNGSGIVSGSVLTTLNGTDVVSGSVLTTLNGTDVVSGSVLRTLNGTDVVSGSVLRTLNGTDVVSGSVLRTLNGTDVVSGSVLRTLDGTSVLSASVTFEQYSASVQTTIDNISHTQIPTGTISGSAQITALGFVSESGDNIPAGTISGSAQITALGFISESLTNLGGTNVLSSSTNFETYSSSVDSRIDTEKTRIDNILSGANADYDQFVEIVNLVNSTDTTNDVAFANHYTSSRQRLTSLETTTSSLQTQIDALVAETSSYLTSETDSQTLSISGDQLTISNGNTITIPTGSNLPNGVISGSQQITDLGFISSSHTQIPSGTVSSSQQIDDLGFLKVNGDDVVSGSVLRTLNGTDVVSGSVLRPNGDDVVSGSVLRTLNGTGVFSGSLVAGTNITINQTGDNFIISSSASGDSIPAGTISGSAQITSLGFISESNFNGSGVVSGSVLRPNGDDVVSGSVVRTLAGSNVVSSSQQISNYNTFLEKKGDGVVSGSVLRTLDGTSVISGSAQITALGFISESTFDGDRIVSNTDLPSGVYNNNFRTSGSVQDFLNAVFFPNSAPSISTGNQTIQEFSGSSSTIVTLSGTDAEGQALTWGTASAYTDDLVRVASNGVMTLNTTATSASFNTDSVGAGHGHLVTVTATDAFSETTEKDIYIIVTPNQAPKFRETSIAGNIITSVTSNLNENSSNGTLVKRIFFTDAESDSITIYSSSISPAGGATHFTITKNSTYVDITQNTGSLDYENITQYTLNISASDEHYEGGQDTDSITTLPITINVTDNLAPTVNNQVVGSINENSSNGTLVGTVSVSDNEGDSVSAPYFQLHKLYLDGIEVSTGSYGGTSQATDPHENAFEINSGNRQITRKTGIYLNSDLVNRYDYRIKVKDEYNQQISSASVVTINITDDIAATLTDNWSAGPYIKESEVSGTTIKTTNYGATTADYNSNQSGTWSSSNPAISINSNGNLSLNVDLSGSVTQSGDTLDSTITFTNTFGTTTTDNLSVTIVANSAPTATFTDQSSNLNANLATTNTNLVLVTITDTESDTPYSASLSGTDASKLNLSYQNSNSSSVYIRANENLSAATYNYNIRVTDNYGKSTDYNSRTITIASASTGSLGGDTSIYIIESAETGSVFRDATGYNQGNAAQLSVSYSPNYGSAVVQSYTSSRQGISVDSSGNLTAGYDFSGSVTSTDYTRTALVSDSTNSTLYDKSLHVNGIKVVQGAATGSQSAVPDAFTEKVAQMIKLMVTSSGADINDTDQANMIGILKGETGTWHSGYPTAQRILRGAGSDYSPNPLDDANWSSYPGLQNFQDSHSTDDMVWYLNSTGDVSGSGDNDAQEVIEHLMHTIHLFGVRGAVSGSFNGLSWDPETDSNWNTRELYYAIKEAVDDSVFNISDYGDASYNTASTFKLIAKEYLYLLNFNMWEYSSLWSGGSLSPEWNDNSRTPSGIQTNNPLGYALYNKYIKPVLTKPSLSTIRSIFQDGDYGDPTQAGSSGYTPEVGTGLISKITFRDQYGNVGSGSVTATVFANQAPTVTFTDQSANFETDLALSGVTMVSMSISDTESDTPYSASLTGTNAGDLQLKYVGANSSSIGLQAASNLSAGTYSYNIKVTDNYGKSTTYSERSFTISTSADYGKTYIYRSNYGTDAGLSSNYLALMGGATIDGSTPPEVTSYTANGTSPFRLISSSLGDSSLSLAGGGTATLVDTISGSDLDTILSSSNPFTMGNTGEQYIIIVPSGSDMVGVPTSMTDSFGGSTTGEYVMAISADGGAYGAEASTVHLIDVDGSPNGYSKYFVIGRTGQNAASSVEIRIIESSGSLPS